MDIASLIGVLIAVGCLGFVGYHSSHGHFAMFYSQEGVFAVFGGTISVIFMSMPLQKILCAGGFIKRFMFNRGANTAETIKTISSLCDKARRDGVLALEAEVGKIEDPFLAAGLRMIVDGSTPENIETTLRLELLAMQDRHKAGKKFFDTIKLYGPGWGLVGTLVGQVGMFGQLGGSVESMGKMLALAVVATMYGTILANAVAGPIGDKLSLRSSEEILNKEMILQGLLSMQAGENPRTTTERLLAFLPNVQRSKLKVA